MSEIFKRYKGNPILAPVSKNLWESYMVFNSAVMYLSNKIHLVYRARGKKDGISRLGYASTRDGFHIDERLDEPIFEPERESILECLGCEDPRLTKIGNKIYMTYTAYGKTPFMNPAVNTIQLAITSISSRDFIEKNWKWGPRYYPFPRVDNKDAFIFPEKIQGQWIMYHRIPPHIWIAYSDDLVNWKNTGIIMSPKEDWEYYKIGGGAPPIKTNEGWLLIYHGVDKEWNYRLGAFIVDLKKPYKILKRSKKPILEPKEEFEVKGDVPNVVFTCGAVLIKEKIYLYYGGADTVICVATAELNELLELLDKI
jgi:predicted GH43/DUF377 family glycosyl hydrolase